MAQKRQAEIRQDNTRQLLEVDVGGTLPSDGQRGPQLLTLLKVREPKTRGLWPIHSFLGSGDEERRGESEQIKEKTEKKN